MTKIIALIALITIVGCSKKENHNLKTRVQFSFNDLRSRDTKLLPLNKSIESITATPTTLADINCYAIMATFPELPQINTCYDTSNVFLERPDMLVGMSAFPGGVLGMEVPVGANRRFKVVGWQWTGGGECPPVFSDHDSFGDLLSEPYLLGGVAGVNIEYSAVSQPIVINISDLGSMTNYPVFGECVGPMFDWGVGEFPGCNPYTVSIIDNVTSDWISCNYDNQAMNPLMYAFSDMAASDVFIVRTNAGNNARIQLSSAPTTDLSFTYEVFAPGSMTTLYSDMGSGATINSSTPCIDLDANASTASGTCSVGHDLQFYALGSSNFVSPYYDGSNPIYAAPVVFGAIQGEGVKLRIVTTTADMGNQYISGGPFTASDCVGFKVAILDQYNRFTTDVSTINVTMSDPGSGVTVSYYQDAACTISAGSMMIDPGQNTTVTYYFKLSGSPSTTALQATATGLIGAHQTVNLQ